MKKIIIMVGIVALFGIVVIFCVNFLATNKTHKDLDAVKNTFIINNENIEEVNDIYVYYGEDTYYIVTYLKNEEEMISVIDDNEKHYIDVKKSELFNIKNKDYIIGYKYDKLIYEIKENVENGFNYIYYDALTGELIKKIELNK